MWGKCRIVSAKIPRYIYRTLGSEELKRRSGNVKHRFKSYRAALRVKYVYACMECVSGSCRWAYELLRMCVYGYIKSASVVVKHIYIYIYMNINNGHGREKFTAKVMHL